MSSGIKVHRTVPLLTPERVLKAYASGLFPMAEGRHDPELYWVDPDWRAVLPFDRFHVPRRLRRTVRSDRFELRVDSDFGHVMRSCAEGSPARRDTWINQRIVKLYESLHRQGNAHSVECWREGGMVGGLYGVSLGGAFFGESMFSRERDASKVALVHLFERLRDGGFVLFDVQFLTAHLRQFGAVELPRADYLARLEEALQVEGRFYSEEDEVARSLQSSTQTS